MSHKDTQDDVDQAVASLLQEVDERGVASCRTTGRDGVAVLVCDLREEHRGSQGEGRGPRHYLR